MNLEKLKKDKFGLLSILISAIIGFSWIFLLPSKDVWIGIVSFYAGVGWLLFLIVGIHLTKIFSNEKKNLTER